MITLEVAAKFHDQWDILSDSNPWCAAGLVGHRCGRPAGIRA